MNPRTWRFLALTQTVLLLAFLIGTPWLIVRTKTETRQATLRALYNYLEPSKDDAIRSEVVVDLDSKNGKLTRAFNGQSKDEAGFAAMVAMVMEVDAFMPIVVRPTAAVPLDELLKTLVLLKERKAQIFLVSYPTLNLALTDHNVSRNDELPDLAQFHK